MGCVSLITLPCAKYVLMVHLCSKFLGKGYKVGRVEQSETALGAEMRLAATKSKGKTAEDKSKDKIVRRYVHSFER